MATIVRVSNTVSIEVDGSELLGVSSLLQGMVERGLNLEAVFLGQIDKSLNLFFKAMFESRGAIGGERWAPLRPATVTWRRRFGQNRGGPSAPLWDTGRSKASLEKVGPESIRVVTPSSYERGSMVPHLVWHQLGYEVKRWGKVSFSDRPGKPSPGLASKRRVPPRRVIPETLPRFLVASWESAIADHIVGAGGNPSFYAQAGRPATRFRS